jgi:hypothetical protein
MVRAKLFCLTFLLLGGYVSAQVDCNTVDIYNLPGKWNWRSAGSASQWTYCEPIRKELQRILPVAMDGLEVTNSIAFSSSPAIVNTPSAPKNYECYLMVKKFECLKTYQRTQPEGETGCWVYFLVNGIGLASHSALHFPYHVNEGPIFIGNFYTEKDALGNRLLYAQEYNRAPELRGYYFSKKDRLPVRTLSWKELLQSYETYSVRELRLRISSLKDGLVRNEKELATTSFADTKTYLENLIRDRKKELQEKETALQEMASWSKEMMNHPRAGDVARVGIQRLDKTEITRLISLLDTKGLYPVWINDISFFDERAPKDAPQCMVLTLRRQDNELPKKKFIDLLEKQFNMDVVCRMVGEEPKKPGGINNLQTTRFTGR